MKLFDNNSLSFEKIYTLFHMVLEVSINLRNLCKWNLFWPVSYVLFYLFISLIQSYILKNFKLLGNDDDGEWTTIDPFYFTAYDHSAPIGALYGRDIQR